MSAWLRPLAVCLLCAVPALGATVGLADWCVNLNGDTNTACNGAGSGGTSPGGGSISLAGWDSTLEPGTNNLGSVVLTLVAGQSDQYAGFYADYDLDYATFGSFQDSGTTVGSLPAGVSYELQDPNVSSIFTDFASNSLADVNTVGTASNSPNVCCDVAFALLVNGLDVPNGGTGTVTFTVSTTAPASGFYLQQTNFDAGDSIYLSENVNISGTGSSTPEPSTFVLALGGIGLGIGFKRRRRC